jgi:hypothetical protein
MESEKIEIGQRLKNGAIVISVTKRGNRSIILALLPKIKEPYVTWCYEESCCKAGHYFCDLELALKDYKHRIEGGY